MTTAQKNAILAERMQRVAAGEALEIAQQEAWDKYKADHDEAAWQATCAAARVVYNAITTQTEVKRG